MPNDSEQLAITIVTISFALQHGLQDTIGIARAFVLGCILAIPVLVTGALLPSIIAHSVVDAFSGLCGPSVMEWLGNRLPPAFSGQRDCNARARGRVQRGVARETKSRHALKRDGSL